MRRRSSRRIRRASPATVRIASISTPSSPARPESTASGPSSPRDAVVGALHLRRRSRRARRPAPGSSPPPRRGRSGRGSGPARRPVSLGLALLRFAAASAALSVGARPSLSAADLAPADVADLHVRGRLGGEVSVGRGGRLRGRGERVGQLGVEERVDPRVELRQQHARVAGHPQPRGRGRARGHRGDERPQRRTRARGRGALRAARRDGPRYPLRARWAACGRRARTRARGSSPRGRARPRGRPSRARAAPRGRPDGRRTPR